ncbi:hypothetical protein NECID01_1993 [Nematocida sp. AWRm77]|nr:hypothetical protein NECID01_1993 [Nematocida sp. AWRm77]
MLKALPLFSKSREQSDMDDLEILGSISFDLGVTKDEKIKQAFVSLVEKLGTEEFLQEYAELYSSLLSIARRRALADVLDLEGTEVQSPFLHAVPDLFCEELKGDALCADVLSGSILREISISEQEGKV